MNEDQIERRVERMMDHLDRLLLGGQIDQKTYNLAVKDLDLWSRLALSNTPQVSVGIGETKEA